MELFTKYLQNFNSQVWSYFKISFVKETKRRTSSSFPFRTNFKLTKYKKIIKLFINYQLLTYYESKARKQRKGNWTNLPFHSKLSNNNFQLLFSLLTSNILKACQMPFIWTTHQSKQHTWYKLSKTRFLVIFLKLNILSCEIWYFLLMICMKQTFYQRDEVSTPLYSPIILKKESNHLYCQQNFWKTCQFLFLKKLK